MPAGESPRKAPRTRPHRATRSSLAGPRGKASGSPRTAATIAPAEPPSSRGLGRRPLTAETGVRIPVAVLAKAPQLAGFLLHEGLAVKASVKVARAETALAARP